MIIKDKIKIFCDEFSIIRPPEPFMADNTLCLGLGEYNNCRIKISKMVDGESIPESREAMLLLHEILHEISESMCANLTERQVGMLACGLLTVLRENQLDFLDTRKE